MNGGISSGQKTAQPASLGGTVAGQERGRKENPLRWMILFTVMVGTFLGRLDQTIVNLALPKIIDDFSITVSAAGWIATAYIIANAVFVPIWGKLGDTIGRKKVYILGFGIFIAGSVLAGLSWNLGSMLAFRIIQAIASSADYPTAMAILAITFRQGRERAQALGIWSSAFAASSILGPLIGGPLIDTFGWRSVFFVNLPVGILGLFLAFRYIEESVSSAAKPAFDWWGAILLGGALSALVLVLDQGMDWGWLSAASILCYAAILALSVLFARIELSHREPIVDFKFFENSLFVHTLINNFIIFMGMMGSVFLIPVFAQTFLGYTATESGYLFIPLAIGFLVSSPAGGALTGKVEARYVLLVSTVVASAGIYFLSFLDPRSTALDIIWPLVIMAIGMGFGMPQRTALVAAAVPEQEIGIASSVLALVRNIAGAFGIAVFSTILQNVTESNALSLARNSIIRSVNPIDFQKGIELMTLKAEVSGYNSVFFTAAAIIFIGALLSIFIRVPKERFRNAPEVIIE